MKENRLKTQESRKYILITGVWSLDSRISHLLYPFAMHTAVTNLAKSTLDHTKKLIKVMDAE